MSKVRNYIFVCEMYSGVVLQTKIRTSVKLSKEELTLEGLKKVQAYLPLAKSGLDGIISCKLLKVENENI